MHMSIRHAWLFAIAILVGCPDSVDPGPINQAPSARIFAPVEGLNSLHGDPLNLTGSCIDPESAEVSLTATWTSDIDGELVEPANPDEQGNVSGTVASMTGGAHLITLTCTDPDGDSATDERNITVQPNQPPLVDIDEPDNGDDFTTDESIPMEISVLDDVDSPDQLSITISSDLDGELATGLVPGSDGDLVQNIELLSGEHLLTVTAVDSEGGEGTATVTVTVTTTHLPPACEILEPLDTGFEVGTDVLFSGQVNDPDVPADLLTVKWSTDLDGEFAVLTPDTAGAVQTHYDGLSVGDHILTMLVVDEELFECSSDTPIRVCEENEAPDVDLGDPAEGDHLAGEMLVFSADVSDDVTDAPALVVSWSSDIDGEFNTDPADALGGLFFQYADLTPGDHVITLSVDDGCGHVTTESVAITVVVDMDGDGYVAEPWGDDCDDDSPFTNPGAPDIAYDGIDQDCSGADLTDIDGDGYDSDLVGGDDCDDNNTTINPGSIDIPYDGIDQDCSGLDAIDLDGDGYDGLTVDCNDEHAAINPGETDIPYDNIDQDCSGADLTDVDGDGYDAIPVGSDCDDNSFSVYPGAPEVPYDGLDQDCNGSDLLDADGDGFDSDTVGGSDCDDANPSMYPGAPEVPYDGVDQDCSGADWDDVDGDGFAGLLGSDCDDNDPTVYPGATETPYDGIDQDCSGADLTDADGDGYSSDLVLGGDDCDDTDILTNPGAADIPYDGIDQDCDGSDLIDVDGDGFAATSAGGVDCNDFIPSVFPGAPEVPGDGLDNDCDGEVDNVEVTSVPGLAGNPYLCVPIPITGIGSYGPPGPALTYEWFLSAAPADSEVTIDDIADPLVMATTFTPDMLGVFVLGLTVTQASVPVLTDTEYLVIAVENDPSNGAPVAVAGDDVSVSGSVSAYYSNYQWNCPTCPGQTANLDGSGSSDPDGNDLTYLWSAVSGSVNFSDSTAETTNATLNGGSVSYNSSTTFNYTIELEVTDCELVSASDTLTAEYTCSCN